MQELDNYADTTADGVKAAVKKAANTVKKEITAGAPERTGRYAKSWRTKTTKESSSALEITVYSPTRYMLAHLLEHGHAMRNGGRVAAKVHIAPAEQDGIEELEEEIGRNPSSVFSAPAATILPRMAGRISRSIRSILNCTPTKRIRESNPVLRPCWTGAAFSLKRPRSGSRANGSTKSFIHLSWR